MGINVSAPTGSIPTKYPSQPLTKSTKTKSATPQRFSLLNRCWNHIKSPTGILGIGLLLLLTKADSAEAKSLPNRKVDLSLPDNLINHTLPDHKGNANGLSDNANQQADTGRPFQPPPLPAFRYTDAQISDWIDYDEPQPLLETAVEGVESGAIMRDLFNNNSSDSFQRRKPWGKSAKIETPYRLPLMLLPHGLFIKDFIGRHVQR